MSDEQRFDIVVSDLGLPDGTGLDVMKYVRARHSLPAIAVKHLIKPIDLSKLQAAINRALAATATTAGAVAGG